MADWIPIYTVDAFAKKPFTGNPAGVCLIPPEMVLSKETKQKIASEMNLSETAFLSLKQGDTSFKTAERFDLCWHTPVSEIPLCGHATLASAKTIFSAMGNEAKEIKFDTLSGELRARRSGDDRISIFLPDTKRVKISLSEVEKFIDVIFPGDVKPIDAFYVPSIHYLMLRCPDQMTRKQFEEMHFNISKLLEVHSDKLIRGVIVTLKGTKENGSVDDDGEVYDFLSRFFAPWYGVDEDPVTGSAHSGLANYWSLQLNKTTMYARQCSKRVGELRLEFGKDVEMSGHSFVVLEGKICIA